MIAVAAVALVAGVGGAALATASAASSATGTAASLTRILDLTLIGHGRFVPRWGQPPSPAA